MKLSLLLRTRNAGRELEKFADRVREGAEMVVVDHASSDDTVDVALRLGGKVVAYPRADFSYGAALNCGVPECTGDWVLVASPHFEPLAADFWPRLMRDLQNLPEDVLACQGTGWITRQADRQPSGMTYFEHEDLESLPWDIHGNSCCAYRRSALERFPFDESLSSAEDAEWCLRVVRAGFRIVVDHRLPYLYRNRAPLSRYWRRGRIDFPSMEKVFGMSFRPHPMSVVTRMAKDFALLLLGRIPFWLWIRLVVRRFSELSLNFF